MAATTLQPNSTNSTTTNAVHHSKVDEEFQLTEDGEIEVFADFEAMDLQENLLRGIFAYGLEKPSAIQTKGIVPTSKGRDTLMHAVRTMTASHCTTHQYCNIL